MLTTEMIAFEQLSGENAELTSISRIGGYLDGYHKAMEKQQWIPCSERLPNEDGKYLVTGKHGAVNIINYENGRWYGGQKPIVWMPLPEPYKGDDK